MPKYRVLATETYQKEVVVEAANEREAEQRVSDAWNNTEFILEPENCFEGAEFYVVGPAEDITGLDIVDEGEEQC